MPYQKCIDRSNPSLLLFLVDQSGSMENTIGGAGTRKQFVVDAISRTISTLVVNATRDDGGPRHYFDVGILGYGNDNCGPGWGGQYATATVHPLPAIAQASHTEKREKLSSDGLGGVFKTEVDFYTWVEPKANGNTPMCAALKHATAIVAEWSQGHQASFPATVVHITDGESTDGDPSASASALCETSTQDGNTLLFNIHIDSREGSEVLMPDSCEGLSSFALTLYNMSSVVTDTMRSRASDPASNLCRQLGPDARLFGYRCDAVGLSMLLDIGTPVAGIQADE